MYLNHYGLDKKPFDISPDPAFLWLSDKHKEALAHLKYGIIDDKGFLVLTGDVGTGKTALIRYLVNSIDMATIVVTIPDPEMSQLDFFNFLASELDMGQMFKSKGEFLIHFKKFLLRAFSSFKKVVLIIDEAQRLNQELLEEIRLLGNIDFSGSILLNIFFIGQNEFNSILLDKKNRAIRQRITANYQISPLSAKEVAEYIGHRLQVAGTAEKLFTPDATKQIYRYSMGYPRLVNIICDRALMTGYAGSKKVISASIVDECARELNVALGDLSIANRDPAPETMPPKKVRSLKIDNLKIAVGSRVLETRKDYQEALAGITIPEYQEIEFSEEELAPLKKDNQKETVGISAAMIIFFLMLASVGYIYRDGFFDSSGSVANRDTVVQSSINKPSLAVINKKLNPIKNSKQAPDSEAAIFDKDPVEGAQEPTADLHASSLPQIRPPLEEKKFIVFFEHDSNQLPPQTVAILNRIIQHFLNFPIANIIVKGYTDSFGHPLYNKKLSKDRANRVKTYLIDKGVPASKVEVHGSGSENPIESNATRDGRKKNRRVQKEGESTKGL
jgi:general secretion pathway protein A